MPPRYTKRNPNAWQREFLTSLDGTLLARFAPNQIDVSGLADLVNVFSFMRSQTLTREDGSQTLLQFSTPQTVVSYALLEMVMRKLLGDYRETSSLKGLLVHFEKNSPVTSAAATLKRLRSRMTSREHDGEVDLYERLRRGRNAIMHGNVLRTSEFEGELVVLVVDLILVHVMLDALPPHDV